jgi:DNA-binding LytR/AlgR family response regulator
MKIRIEVDDKIAQEEVIVRCRQLNSEVIRLQKLLEQSMTNTNQFVFFKGETEYYLPSEEILFFETDGGVIHAHTVDDVFETKYKLYELEELLPRGFLRISKSAIVNTDKIYSIHRNLTSSSLIAFQHTHKQIYVSRSYYKLLKDKLEEKRLGR